MMIIIITMMITIITIIAIIIIIIKYYMEVHGSSVNYCRYCCHGRSFKEFRTKKIYFFKVRVVSAIL